MKVTVCSTAVLTVAVTMLPMASSCVDDNYDLTKDIDLTVSMGGNLTLPASSTDELKLSKVLDLEKGSSIKEVEYPGQYGAGTQVGDYVLVQEGNDSHYDFNIPVVEIKDMGDNESKPTELPPFINPGTVDMITVDMTNPTVNDINISDDEVTEEILSLQSARTDIDIRFTVEYKTSAASAVDYNGLCYIEEGYVVEFSDTWTIEIADAHTAEFLEVIDSNKLRFRERTPIAPDEPLIAEIRIVNVDFTDAPAGQGLYEVGHFRMDATVESMGSVSIVASGTPAMSTVILDFVTTTEVVRAELKAATGVFAPVIDVDPTTFDITDIPDFLKEKGNKLDLDDPRFYLSLSNRTPLPVTLAAKLESYKNGDTESIGNVEIGAPATAQILIPANVDNYRICLSQKPVDEAGVQNIVIPDLTSLISTIPDYISVSDIDVKAVRESATLSFGDDEYYHFENNYEVIVPLAFGSELNFVYDDTERDWDTDLDAVNLKEAKVSLTAVSTIPLTLTPEVEVLDRDGNVMTTVEAVVEGTVGGGSIDSPSRNTLTITLKSTGENLDGLDGIRYKFTAVSDPDAVGVTLNSGQSLRFEDIKISIAGGVTADLNDDL